MSCVCVCVCVCMCLSCSRYNYLLSLHFMHFRYASPGISTWILHHLCIHIQTKQTEPDHNYFVFQMVAVVCTTYCVPFLAVLRRSCAVKVEIAFIIVFDTKVFPFGQCLVNENTKTQTAVSCQNIITKLLTCYSFKSHKNYHKCSVYGIRTLYYINALSCFLKQNSLTCICYESKEPNMAK